MGRAGYSIGAAGVAQRYKVVPVAMEVAGEDGRHALE
jgi:hypothetical protein